MFARIMAGLGRHRDLPLRDVLKLPEQERAVEIARNLIDVLDDETIAEKTGLCVEEVARLRQDLL
ncbi:hypothetical protein VU04_11600 [Desulfobulbus sp. TB]|nr:hypothetical protein [Desulfobulbus sp. TB]